MNESTSNLAPKISTVYTLHDECLNVRYVGITCQPLKDRLRMHLNDAKRGKRTYCAAWIRSMPQPPTIEAVETTSDRTREIYWIAKFRDDGIKLTNLTDGGEGLPGLKFTEDHCARISRAVKENYDSGFVSPRKGKKSSAEHCAKIKAANTGRKLSLEACQKIGAASKGRVKSAETIAKLSAASKGHITSAETRAKIAAAHRGKVVSQESRARISAARLLYYAKRRQEKQLAFGF